MKYVAFLFYALSTLPVLLGLESFKSLPWNSSLSLSHNIEPYVRVLISVGVFMQMRSVLTPLLKSGGDNLELTANARGFVRNIEYSATRINNSPRFKALVFYSGIEKEFDLLPEAFQFNFNVGDEVVVRHHPDDENNSTLDFDLSLAKKSESQ
jgi:hypothetical protein